MTTPLHILRATQESKIADAIKAIPEVSHVSRTEKGLEEMTFVHISDLAIKGTTITAKVYPVILPILNGVLSLEGDYDSRGASLAECGYTHRLSRFSNKHSICGTDLYKVHKGLANMVGGWYSYPLTREATRKILLQKMRIALTAEQAKRRQARLVARLAKQGITEA